MAWMRDMAKVDIGVLGGLELDELLELVEFWLFLEELLLELNTLVLFGFYLVKELILHFS
jgi:hypothetical protein